MAPPNKGKGKALAWIKAHVDHAGEGCLEWPFSRSRGYGNLGVNGKVLKAYRVMCELVHGPAPSPAHEGSHSCGRGDQGCVHPKHISWKTRVENQRDRKAHGTAGRGNQGGKRFTLTATQVLEIRALPEPVNREAVGRQYGVDQSTIRMILKGETWNPNKKWIRQLTPQEVIDIRRQRGIRPYRVLAAEYGLREGAVSRIMNNKTYRDVSETEAKK